MHSKSVTHVCEHVLPISPVYTPGEGVNGIPIDSAEEPTISDTVNISANPNGFHFLANNPWEARWNWTI